MCLLKCDSAMADRSLLRHSLVVLMVSVVVVSGLDGYTTRVTTRFGQIQGLWNKSIRGRLVIHYLGIPYAEPPVGDLRFRSPQPWHHTWNRIFEATKNGPMCVQLDKNGNATGSEDCLYLNIYVPVISEKRGENVRLPVMFYVHGGKFASGSGNSHRLPPHYLMDQDIILVTVNYRLNILGFFSTASKASPGNYGLKDVLMALRWVNENIESFDGDPDNITIWGHSAGAAVVHALTLSDKTKGLFSRYIMQSGSTLCPWSLNSWQWVRKIATETAKHVGCLPQRDVKDHPIDCHPNETVSMQPEVCRLEDGEHGQKCNEEQEMEMMQCMRKVDAAQLLRYVNYFELWDGYPCCIFGPTVEEKSKDAILTMHPLRIIKNRLYRGEPFIAGVVRDEGLAATVEILQNATLQEALINNFETYLTYMLNHHQLVSNSTVFADAIADFYLDRNVSLNLRRNITQVTTDGLMTWPIYRMLKLQSEHMNSSAYFYLFSYEGTFSSTFSSRSTIHYGVSHADDLNYLIPLLNKEYQDQMLHNTENDITMINIMTEMWASFATTGVPKAWQTPTWPDYKKSHEFLRFGNGKDPRVSVEREFFTERMAFWEELSANLSLHFMEPETNTQSLIKDEEDKSNSGSTNKSNEILACLLISIAVSLSVGMAMPFIHYVDNKYFGKLEN